MSDETKCTYCDRPAVYFATSEGDPYVLACDQCCCGEGDLEDGHSVRIDDARGLLSLALASNDRVAQAVAEEREAIRAEIERRTPYAANMIEPCAWIDARSMEGKTWTKSDSVPLSFDEALVKIDEACAARDAKRAA